MVTSHTVIIAFSVYKYQIIISHAEINMLYTNFTSNKKQTENNLLVVSLLLEVKEFFVSNKIIFLR